MKVSSTTDPQTSTVTIAVNNLSKRFNREWIFRGLSYEFTPGNKYAITGPNGAGKSTLLQVIWGQTPQTSGSIRYEKAGIAVPIEAAFSHLAIATPYMDLIDEFTLQEMVDFHFKLKNLRAGFNKEELLARMYLKESAGKHLSNFSSGMKQRLKLALACFTDADVYFFDEPGTNLDSRAFDWYLSQLQQLPGNALVFIASNNPEEYPANAHILNITDYK